MTIRTRAAVLIAGCLIGGAAWGAAAGSLAGAPPGTVVFRGDYETGDLGQWGGVQSISGARARVVRSPAAQGAWAARFEVRNGEDPLCRRGFGCFGDRSEVQETTGESEGDVRFYEWSTRFGSPFPVTSRWQVVTQWRPTRDSGEPSVGMYVSEGRLQLQVNPHNANGSSAGPPRVLWSGPLDRGQWHRYRLRVTWSGSDRRGALKLWVDGRAVTPMVRVRTLYPGEGAYLKQGYYRQSGIGTPGVVYHDGLIVTQTSR